MARPLRLNLADGWYHVFHRATGRCVLFRDSRDRDHWSSYRAYAGYVVPPSWLRRDDLLALAHRDPARREAQYRREAQEKLTHGADIATLERLLDRVGIGHEAFFEADSVIGPRREPGD